MLLPGLGEADAPAIIRVGIALSLTLVLLPVVAPLVTVAPVGFLMFAKMISAEIINGLWLGWLSRIIVLALPIAGQMISYMLGLSSVLQADAGMGPGTTALGRLFSLAIPVTLLSSGLYALPVTALVGSYQLIPPGHLLSAQLGAEQAVATVSAGFSLALRLASPFLIASVVWYTAVGLMSRLTARIQLYFVAAPAQILGGICLFGFLIGIVITLWQRIIGDQFAALPGLH